MLLRKLNFTEMKIFFVLSMIVPLGLLTTFRFAGVLPEPPTLVTIAAEPVSWQIDRPKRGIIVDDLVEKVFHKRGSILEDGLARSLLD